MACSRKQWASAVEISVDDCGMRAPAGTLRNRFEGDSAARCDCAAKQLGRGGAVQALMQKPFAAGKAWYAPVSKSAVRALGKWNRASPRGGRVASREPEVFLRATRAQQHQ